MMRKFILLLIKLSILSSVASSQKQNLKFQRIETAAGLSHSTVLCVFQDSRGFLWFGTKDGLNKYDGYKFTVYKTIPNNPSTISNNIVRAIAEDKRGNLWIATWGGGLNMFDRGKEKFVRFGHSEKIKHSLSSDFVNCLLIDKNNRLWIGSTSKSIDLLEPDAVRFKHIPLNRAKGNGIESTINCLLEDNRGNIWAGTTNQGLLLLDARSGTLRDSNALIELKANNITALYQDSRNVIWAGTFGKGLVSVDFGQAGSGEAKKERIISTSATIISIGGDNEHNLWLGTENEGLMVLPESGGEVQRYSPVNGDTHSLSSNTINSIIRDSQGNMWLGTLNGGISQVNIEANKFTHYKNNPFTNSLSHNTVLCFTEDSENNIWIGTDGGGLNLFNPYSKNFTHFKHKQDDKNSISGNHVLTVKEDSKGNLWAGTWGEGISVLNKERTTFKHFKNDPSKPNSLSNNNSWIIFEDRDKTMWIGTYGGGLNRYDVGTDSFVRYKNDPNDPFSLSSNYILSISEDSEGFLWIGTDAGGLNRFDKELGKFRHYKHEENRNSISNNSVGCIYEDRNGDLWMGTNSGLNCFNRKKNTFKTFFRTDGLPDDVVFGILEDSNGNLWISTNKGISQFNPQTKRFTNYTEADGLQSSEFKERAYCRSRSGKMYFGGRNGFNEFYPDSIREKHYNASVVITGFQIFNKAVPIVEKTSYANPLTKHISETAEINISHKQSVISFEFAALDYADPELKTYAYLLEGFDRDWNQVNSKNSASYTNLDPGTYVFKVKAGTYRNQWSSKIARLKINVAPPFWKTWWFNILTSVTFLGFFIAFHKVRTRMIRKQKRELERQVVERTEEIRRQAEEIERINLLLKQDNKKLEHDVEDITKARVMQKNLSFKEFKQIFPDDDTCLKFISEIKWKKGFICKKCTNETYSPWKSPYSRRCTRCNYIESATAFTIFHSLKFSILKAFYLLFLVNTRKSITAEELSEILEISSKSCKTFKKKIQLAEAELKPKRKNYSWEDLIV